MGIWIEGAPVLGIHSDADICAFVDRFITCSVSDASPDNLAAQSHNHSYFYCLQKRGKHGSFHCRFGFPKPPLDATRLLRPLPDDLSADQKRACVIYSQTIRAGVKSLDADSGSSGNLTFFDFLVRLNLTFEQYLLGLRAPLTQPALFVKRDLNAIRINPYNPKLLEMQNSNVDTQFVLEPYSAPAYINSYMMKTNLTLSRLLQDACRRAREETNNPSEVLRAMGNALLNGQEICAQHAVYGTIGLPFRGSSRTVVFIPTSPPAERAFLIKPDWELRCLPAGSTDCMAMGPVEKYACRHRNVSLRLLGADAVCLADFVSLFDPVYKASVTDEDFNEDEMCDQETDCIIEDQPECADTGPSTSALGSHKKSSAFENREYKLSRERKVIRYVRYKMRAEPELYFREQLLLFWPWSSLAETVVQLHETEDACLLSGCKTFAERYAQVKSGLEANRKPFVFNKQIDWESVERFTEDFEDADFPPASEPGAAQSSYENESYDIGPDLDLTTKGVASTAPIVAARSVMTDEAFRNLVRQLTWDQKRYLYHLLHHYKFEPERPLCEFLTGGAGTGKSVLVTAAAECITRFANSRLGVDPHSLKVLIMAFTGNAAFNVGGSTLHHALRLPFGQRLLPYRKLSAEWKSKLRNVLKDLFAAIIDEISMSGATLLYLAHRRLQEIFDDPRPFGGIPVITVGDLYQLKPVGDHYCFEGVHLLDSAGKPCLLQNIWSDFFRMFELTTILRQVHGMPYACTMNRLRTGDHTQADLAYLKTFEVDPSRPPPEYSVFMRHIFATHLQLD